MAELILASNRTVQDCLYSCFCTPSNEDAKVQILAPVLLEFEQFSRIHVFELLIVFILSTLSICHSIYLLLGLLSMI